MVGECQIAVIIPSGLALGNVYAVDCGRSHVVRRRRPILNMGLQNCGFPCYSETQYEMSKGSVGTRRKQMEVVYE